jgi:hypothetical protein
MVRKHKLQLREFGTPLVLTILLALFSCGRTDSGLPSQLTRFPADLGDAKLETSGIYDDGWTEKTVSVNLHQPAEKKVFSVRGTIPKINAPDFSSDIVLFLDNKELARRSVGLGDFEISAPVENKSGKRHVKLAFSALQQLPNGDGRNVGARLISLGFEDAKPGKDSASSAPFDIVHGAGVRLGSGWGVLETFHDETFRWVENDAQIFITSDKPGAIAISLLVEPGPGVGGKAFLLKALDTSGRQVDAALVEGREAAKLFLPVEGDGPSEFQLHADGGGRTAPGDARILNFRVFQMEARP